MAAWLRPYSQQIQRHKERLGKITKQGDRYIRKLLVVGMTSRAVDGETFTRKGGSVDTKIITDKPFRFSETQLQWQTRRPPPLSNF